MKSSLVSDIEVIVKKKMDLKYVSYTIGIARQIITTKKLAIVRKK